MSFGRYQLKKRRVLVLLHDSRFTFFAPLHMCPLWAPTCAQLCLTLDFSKCLSKIVQYGLVEYTGQICVLANRTQTEPKRCLNPSVLCCSSESSWTSRACSKAAPASGTRSTPRCLPFWSSAGGLKKSQGHQVSLKSERLHGSFQYPHPGRERALSSLPALRVQILQVCFVRTFGIPG